MTDWEKRAREEDMFPVLAQDEQMLMPMNETRRRAIQLGREMADARAEEIAKAIEREVSTGCDPIEVHDQCVTVARSTITKPKTREQVLEEALRELSRVYHMPLSARTMGDIDAIIERALSRKS